MTLRNALKGLLKRIATSGFVRPVGRPLLHAAQYVLSLHSREVVSFAQPARAQDAARVRQILTEWPTLTMGVDEAYMLRAAVLSTAKVGGDIAEVGVFRGASAKVICEAKGDRRLHLFDTFEGLPAPGDIDTAFREGQYASSLESVREYLKDYAQVALYKGRFPGTGASVTGLVFSFVHLDVDLYESTLAALEFFYPRLKAGGVIISHDYVEFAGVRKAFDEFFAQRVEPVIELSGNQCLVVKALDPLRVARIPM